MHQIAYQLLRCKADAEDIVQDTIVRWLTIDTQAIENKRAYLVKMVTNNCLNHLDALKKKKQAYLDSIQLPEFVQQFKEMDLSQLDIVVEVRNAMGQLQGRLQPLERAVFVLKEAMGFDYDELQEALQKKKDHLRQLLSRAKKKLGDQSTPVRNSVSGRLLESFSKASSMGDSTDLIAELKRETDNVGK